MDMETAVVISLVSLIVNVLMGLIMFFAKYTVDDLKDKLKVHQEAIDRIRDTYIKREDFREFKEELFVRLDEMKLDFKHEVERLKQ